MIKEIANKAQFNLITDNQSLAQVCNRAAQKEVVALDTEFVRTRSYYPKLGLIQLYDGEQVSLIDPVAINDFSPFIKLLINRNVTKVLHACYEDLEVFQHYFQQLPFPLIDTQIAALFIGFPQSSGLATLIQHYFELQIDKGAFRTDWLARPLSERQLQYAAADVWYLLPLYHKMWQQLAQTPWQQAVQFDSQLLLEKQTKPKPADKAYLSLPHINKFSAIELMRLKLLAQWRQEEAIKRDLAVNFVVKSNHLCLVAQNAPKHTSKLLDMELTDQEVRIHGKKLLSLVEKANAIPAAQYPERVARLSEDSRYKSSLKQLQQALKVLTPVGLSTEVVASKKSLESLMKWVWYKQKDPNKLPNLMRDWRASIGKELVELLENE